MTYCANNFLTYKSIVLLKIECERITYVHENKMLTNIVNTASFRMGKEKVEN